MTGSISDSMQPMSTRASSGKLIYSVPRLSHFGSMAVKTQGMAMTGGDGSTGKSVKFT